MAAAKKPEVVEPKEKVAKVLTKKERIAQTMGAINKQYGAGTVGNLKDKAKDFEIIQRTTKCQAFNQMLHGGFADGTIIELYGTPDAGKTSMAFDFIGYRQSLDEDFHAGWYETEGLFDIDYAVGTFGIDPERFSAFEMAEAGGAEKGLDVLETLVRSGDYNCMVINTIAGLTPAAEINSDMSQQLMGTHARLISKLLRKITAVARKKRCTLIFINQVRTDIGGYKGPEIATGGLALRFWASQRVAFRAGFIEAEEKAKGYDPAFFKKIDCTVKKNRISHGKNPYQKCTYYVEYGVGIDMIGEIPDIAVELGILNKSGAFYSDPSDVIDKKTGKAIPRVVDGVKYQWQGGGQLRTYLRDTPDYVAELRARIEGAGGAITTTVTAMSAEEIDEAKTEEAKAAELLKEAGVDLTEGSDE